VIGRLDMTSSLGLLLVIVLLTSTAMLLPIAPLMTADGTGRHGLVPLMTIETFGGGRSCSTAN
jgi:hypothetical protein